MDYIINGRRRLSGETAVYGAKNCALPLLGASILTDDCVILHNCPPIVDVENMLKLLAALGKQVSRQGDTVILSGPLTSTSPPRDIAALLRGSALILGSVLGRYGQIDLPLPGGCAIGQRPMDIHLAGLSAMGVTTDCFADMLKCCGKPKSGNFTLRFASVGATENLLCAAVLAEGQTVLENCAIEPEVEALEQFLVKMGADISSADKLNIVIKGVKKLHGAEFTIIPDRIVTATYLSAVVASGGDVTVTNCNPTHLKAFFNLLKRNYRTDVYKNAIRIKCDNQTYSYGRVSTAPYPFFPTDMQSLLMSLAAFADGGTTVIRENLFENRLDYHAGELGKMGADIKITGNSAVIVGRKLYNAAVEARDLRGGAGLVVAGLNAEGATTVKGVCHIERGYLNLHKSLAKLGADIKISL